MNRKPWTAAALTGAILLTLTACGTAAPEPASTTAEATISVPESIREKGVLDVATFYNYPPYTMVEDGEVTGIEPPLVEAIAERLGLEVRFHDMKFEAMIPSVVNGRNDLMIGMLADTAERREEVSFLDLTRSSLRAMVREGNPTDVDPNELCGVKVGESAGSYQEGVVKKLSAQCEADGKPPIELMVTPDPATNFLSLINGRIDVTLQNTLIAHYSAEQRPELETLDAPVEFDDAQVNGWIFAKDSDELIEAFVLAIEEMVDDGTWLDLLAEHGLEEDAILPPTVNTEPLGAE